jgi:hypothetical protein
MAKPTASVQMGNHGSVVSFLGLTPEAVEFLHTQLATAPWQWLGDSLVVDSWAAGKLVEILMENGLSVEVV